MLFTELVKMSTYNTPSERCVSMMPPSPTESDDGVETHRTESETFAPACLAVITEKKTKLNIIRPRLKHFHFACTKTATYNQHYSDGSMK